MNTIKTIICDIDGCISRHNGNINTIHMGTLDLLPGAMEKFKEWDRRGYNIILMTGRRESVRVYTEKQLAEAGIFYDMLIMGVKNGQRVLINDMKEGSEEPMAIAVNLVRNRGIEKIDL